jgi:hypothetical protein
MSVRHIKLLNLKIQHDRSINGMIKKRPGPLMPESLPNLKSTALAYCLFILAESRNIANKTIVSIMLCKIDIFVNLPVKLSVDYPLHLFTRYIHTQKEAVKLP